ncbi:MAG: GHMP kinase [Planctomycetes bacterium]|jgi:galactokinase|nr:GHMP kinase [Phycisphaerae bacterium]NBB94774.1 GHMP kinase [Planctomycetota bacterium]
MSDINTGGAAAELFVSGRVCLFGEHTDWAADFGLHAGHCVVIGTDQGLRATARPCDDLVIQTLVPDADGRPTGRSRQVTCTWDGESLKAAAKDDLEFFRHCAGTAYQMLDRHGVTGGVELHIGEMDLPLGKGVSSSAAVCILVARAFNAVYRLGLFPHELMEAAYLGERLTGSQCGRMDQACIYGKTPVLLTFQKSADIRIEPVFPGGDIEMFIVDLAGRKDTVRILEDLNAALPRSRALQQALGADNERVVRQAYQAIERGQAETLGLLMTEAQAIFDEKVAPHCPGELASPLLHELLGFDALASHVFGGKGVGSQGDGTAQFVARSPDDRDAAIGRIAERFPTMQCFPLTIPAAPRQAAGVPE